FDEVGPETSGHEPSLAPGPTRGPTVMWLAASMLALTINISADHSASGPEPVTTRLVVTPVGAITTTHTPRSTLSQCAASDVSSVPPSVRPAGGGSKQTLGSRPSGRPAQIALGESVSDGATSAPASAGRALHAGAPGGEERVGCGGRAAGGAPGGGGIEAAVGQRPLGPPGKDRVGGGRVGWPHTRAGVGGAVAARRRAGGKAQATPAAVEARRADRVR